ncbi:MAG: hypothetical protein EXS36_10670 [Pedosphaera sp.]|nr:hypothetical protein [Pedosphaera sp.]
MGQNKVKNPTNGHILDQYTGYVAMEYGLPKNFALDATLGYTRTDTDAFGRGSDDGLADSLLGLRYRILDEHQCTSPFAPTISARIGGIIAGTYDENLPLSAGDGAHGFESSLLLAKAWGAHGFGSYGDIGYRLRSHPTPDEFFGSAGIYQQIGPVTINVGYRHIQSTSGLDIGGPGFNPGLGKNHGFSALKEINQLVEGCIGF